MPSVLVACIWLRYLFFFSADKPSGKVQISEGRFGAFKHDLIEDVESRLLSDVKYAKAHGINLKDIAKDFENRAKVAKLSPKPRSTASDEREDKDLASLHKRPLPPSNM
ncbi:uncharacterized protein LOC106172169 [Lingula anatina]|uniref:Uncharacterized protein LOC106172169 n=1 Tax=Lingula anatina TaxID=7574 RepID=A0A1S3JCV0_LINAN|nr:uncharacterized protein LOC106172169 [Lingula anatina]|eukprot:XP_013408240.1 uncharacterized protein LOC106172169 [Lingula anatina]